MKIISGLSTADMLQLLRLNKKGKLVRKGNYKYAVICAILIDLVNMNKIEFKQQNENRIIIKPSDTQATGDLLLDEIFITIRDCPKTYSLTQWFNRLIDCYDAYEKIHFKSLEHKEILKEERSSKKFTRWIIFSLLILIIPMFMLALAYYMTAIKEERFIIKNPKMLDQIRKDMHETLTSLEMPDSSMVGLISILSASGLYRHLVNAEYHDYFIKKYYQFRDFDFNDEDVKTLIQYLTKRDPNSPITTTSAMEFGDFLDITYD